MNKFAKIESPSEEEKKHVSEEEQYIDQPVADDIKNKKIFNKRSVNNMYYNNEYEGMVHEAYEDILGLEKEAGAQADLYKATKDQRYAAADPGSRRGFYDEATTKAGKEEIEKFLAKKNKAGKGSNLMHNLSNPVATAMMWRGLSNKQKAAIIGGGSAAALGIGAGTAALIHNRKKKKGEEVAEKAAAYYDEAQLAKEAAANDYEVACAYEDAALSILSELGYFDEE